MARYFMHICDGHGRAVDEEGFEAENLSAAHNEARRLIAAIIRDQVGEGKGPDGQYVEITNALNQVLDVVAFKDVLRSGIAL